MKISNFAAWLNYLLSMIDDDPDDSLSIFSESYIDSFYAAPIVTSIYSFETTLEFAFMFYSSDIASMQIVIDIFVATPSALKNCVSASYRNEPCCNKSALKLHHTGIRCDFELKCLVLVHFLNSIDEKLNTNILIDPIVQLLSYITPAGLLVQSKIDGVAQ